MKKKLLILASSLFLIGCEVKIEEEKAEIEKKLYVEEKIEEKEISMLPKDLMLIKQEKNEKIYKDENDKLFLVKEEYFYEGQDAMKYIERDGLLNFEEKIDVFKNIDQRIGKEKEIKFIKNDEVVEEIKVEENEHGYTVKSLRYETQIRRKSEEKEDLEKNTEKNEEEQKDEFAEEVIKNIKKTYYEKIEWLEEMNAMMNYANKRWMMVEQGNELTTLIDGDEYLKNVDGENEIREKIKDKKILIRQYIDKEIYEIEYEIVDDRNIKENGRIIIKEKEVLEEE